MRITSIALSLTTIAAMTLAAREIAYAGACAG